MKNKFKIVISSLCVISTLFINFSFNPVISMADDIPESSVKWEYINNPNGSDNNTLGNIGIFTYTLPDNTIGAQVNTNLIKEYIDEGDRYIEENIAKTFLSASNAKSKMSTLLADKGVTSLKENPICTNINNYSLIDSEKYNTFEEFANAIKNIQPSVSYSIDDPNAIMTINAHFHNANANSDYSNCIVSFTDNSSGTAMEQYQAYLNSHPSGSLDSPSGCYTLLHEIRHTHPEQYLQAIPSGHWESSYWYNASCSCGGCWNEERTWVDTTRYEWWTRDIYDYSTWDYIAGCPYSQGQILSIEYDYLGKQGRW